MARSENVLDIRGLTISYGKAPAVHGVDLQVSRGEFVALVGESGSGKSSIANATLGLLPSNATIGGELFLNGIDVTHSRERDWWRRRGSDVSLVPQDPTASLNPVQRIWRQVTESQQVHGPRRRARDHIATAAKLLESVDVPDPQLRATQYPGALSGGMRQRVLIASAIAGNSPLLVADEPTTALDVTVQRRIMDLIEELRHHRGLGVLFVTHDLALAAERADRVVVLRDGQVVETGGAQQVFSAPQHHYTVGLVAGIRDLRAASGRCLDGDREPVVTARGIGKQFSAESTALAQVSFKVLRGQTLGVVGGSGSGKTTLGRIVLGLETPTSGAIDVDGRDLATVRSAAALRRMRQHVQVVYQNPSSSLNPRYSVRQILDEPLKNFRLGSPDWRRRRIDELLEQVRLPRQLLDRRAGELSGGQGQRVAIARALSVSPRLVVLDEAIASLDVSTQDAIVTLLRNLQSELGIAYLFISHDLGAVRSIAHDVLVLDRGRIVEAGPVDDVFDAPTHGYTRELLAAIPRPRSGDPTEMPVQQ